MGEPHGEDTKTPVALIEIVILINYRSDSYDSCICRCVGLFDSFYK